jgi:riboflavin synthase
MFTGLIAATGKLASLKKSDATLRVTIDAPPLIASRLREGDSVAVNGVCLTALNIGPKNFSADIAAETIARTTLGNLATGATVNLELPIAAGEPLGGHIVQGHVDGVGRITALNPIHPAAPNTSDWDLRVAVPQELAAAVLKKGSIALDGISLTVADVTPIADGVEVRVAIIPHTYAATHLHTLKAGSPINIETDVLAKYAARRAESASTLTLENLLANGY